MAKVLSSKYIQIKKYVNYEYIFVNLPGILNYAITTISYTINQFVRYMSMKHVCNVQHNDDLCMTRRIKEVESKTTFGILV